MIRPPDVDSQVWETILAAAAGDIPKLGALVAGHPHLARAQYWYTPPLHFAVREGHVDAARLLLEAGADPGHVGLHGDDLVTMARDRGHAAMVALLEDALARSARTRPAAVAEGELPVHAAAEADDVPALAALLDGDPALVARGDRKGATPLHRAAAASARGALELLLDRGADVDAQHGAGPGDAGGYAPVGFAPIDIALARRDLDTARRLVERGARVDVTIAAAFGDLAQVTSMLDADAARLRETRPNGMRPLTAAVRFGHESVVRLLLDRGADPNWPEADAPRGAALHAAARAGNRALVERLLDHGADPNGGVESSGSATWAAKTPELRALLLARGGTLDAYDLIFLNEDEEALRRVQADPRAADEGCGGALAAAATLGKRELLEQLLAAGARVPPMLTPCRGYLLGDPEMLARLLASGMDPNLPNWQRQTPLHDVCGRDARGRASERRVQCAVVLLDAGADLSARDEEYRSTPLGWAARSNLADLVELLLSRGAPARHPGDPAWATPLAWATRRGHTPIVEILRRAGAID